MRGAPASPGISHLVLRGGEEVQRLERRLEEEAVVHALRKELGRVVDEAHAPQRDLLWGGRQEGGVGLITVCAATDSERRPTWCGENLFPNAWRRP